MKTIKILLLLLPLMVYSGCNGQTKDTNTGKALHERSIAMNDTLSKPQVNVRVNKQYDDKGNIIRYDSTYSYFYNSPGGRMMQSSTDTIYNHFRTYFDKSYPDFLRPKFNDIFFNDSLFQYDFFNRDYFKKRFELNNKLFENMYRQMDSLKLDYMDRTYPKGYSKKKTI